ncbi:MAG: MFS transporter [Burkholderiales bacterium]
MQTRAAWAVVAVGFVGLALSFAYRNLLQLSMTGIEADLGWSRSFVSLGATVGLFGMAMGNLFGGVLIDRYGPRNVVTAGFVALGAGILGTALAYAPWQYLVLFGAVAGVGFGLLTPVVLSSAVARYFVQRRGLALGITTSGGTTGQIVLIPLAAVLLAAYDWRTAFTAAGVLALLLAPVAYLALRDAGEGAAAPSGPPRSLATDLGALLRSPVFHLLFWGFFLCGFTSIGVIETHFVPYATFCGFPTTTAANAFGLLSLLNLVGIILAGWLADRMNRALLLAAIYGLRGLTFVLLLGITDNLPQLFLFAGLFGLFDYATVPVVASLVASHIGLRVMGFAMGLIGMAHQLGAAAGALGGGIAFDLYNSYAGLWMASLAFALVAAALSILIRPQPGASPA